MALNGKQRRQLRAMGHHLNPVVIVGQEGVTPGVIAAVEQALYDHELIKVKINEGPDDRKTAARRLAVDSGSELAQVLGRTALLYKARPDDPKIVLVKGGGIAAEGEELEDETEAGELDVEDTLRYGTPISEGAEDTDVHGAHYVDEAAEEVAAPLAAGAEGDDEDVDAEERAAEERQAEEHASGEDLEEGGAEEEEGAGENEELEREEELAEDTGEELSGTEVEKAPARRARAAPKKKAAAAAPKKKAAKPAAKKKPAAKAKTGAKATKSAKSAAAKKPAAAKKKPAVKKAPAKKAPAKKKPAAKKATKKK